MQLLPNKIKIDQKQVTTNDKQKIKSWLTGVHWFLVRVYVFQIYFQISF